MARSITLTLGAGLGADLGPNFNLTANVGSVTPSTATKTELVAGKSVIVDDAATQVTITSTGTCTNAITQTIPCAGQTTTSTSTTTTTSAPSTVQVDWVVGTSSGGGGRLEIFDINNTSVLDKSTTGTTQSGTIYISQANLPYTVVGSWTAGSGNIVRYRICDITNLGEIYYSGDIDINNGSVSYQVYPTPLHTSVALTSGGQTPLSCPV